VQRRSFKTFRVGKEDVLSPPPSFCWQAIAIINVLEESA
jgi:hypothetical protein